MKVATKEDVVPAAAARRLLLAGQGLLADPARQAPAGSVYRTVRDLGYVQIDTISVVERAHHHILMTRLDGYRPPMLTRLLERDRKLFEHWTHDAAVIPTAEFPFWRLRFERERRRQEGRRWWSRIPSHEREQLFAEVRSRLQREGPLRSADFEGGPRRPGGWWNWKPAKLVLEYLWRTGEVSIHGRDGFQKLYDLTERVLPAELTRPVPSTGEHVEWACSGALARLGAATPREIRAFYEAVSADEVRDWSGQAVEDGRAVPVLLEPADGGRPARGLALPDWRRRARRTREAPARMRLLSPFDPLVRERERTARVFGFDYRFEAFVPAAKRRFGYYVMPILEGDRLTGRVDARLARKEGRLEVLGLWWEPGIEPTAGRRRLLDDALALYSAQAGAGAVTWDGSRDRPARPYRSPRGHDIGGN